MIQKTAEPILITDPEQFRGSSPDGLDLVARLMDAVFVIPGTNIRFGLDALIGLLPGLGDTVTSFVSLYILQVASEKGVPRVVLVRMATNIAIDYVVGAVPLFGDFFDVYWKSNLKNVELLKQHTLAGPTERRRARAGDWLFLMGLFAVLIALLVGSLTIAYWIMSSVWQLIAGARA